MRPHQAFGTIAIPVRYRLDDVGMLVDRGAHPPGLEGGVAPIWGETVPQSPGLLHEIGVAGGGVDELVKGGVGLVETPWVRPSRPAGRIAGARRAASRVHPA